VQQVDKEAEETSKNELNNMVEEVQFNKGCTQRMAKLLLNQRIRK
jgi:hypothetical protein